MNHGGYDHVLRLDLLDEAVGILVQMPDVVVPEFRHDLADEGQAVENVGFFDEVLNDLLRIVPGVVGDKIMDGSKVGLGRGRPDHHD